MRILFDAFVRRCTAFLPHLSPSSSNPSSPPEARNKAAFWKFIQRQRSENPLRGVRREKWQKRLDHAGFEAAAALEAQGATQIVGEIREALKTPEG